jgi:methylglyoxal synthase
MKNEIRLLAARKRIALVAHDNKKRELIEWAYFGLAEKVKSFK